MYDLGTILLESVCTTKYVYLPIVFLNVTIQIAILKAALKLLSIPNYNSDLCSDFLQTVFYITVR